MPTELLLVLVGLCFFVVKCGRRARAVDHRCKARPVWSGVRDNLFVLDALVESCDDPDVPRGTPFSLRLVPPHHHDDYLFARLRTSMAHGHPLLVEVEEDGGARRARLCAAGWTRVLEVEHASGWPQS